MNVAVDCGVKQVLWTGVSMTRVRRCSGTRRLKVSSSSTRTSVGRVTAASGCGSVQTVVHWTGRTSTSDNADITRRSLIQPRSTRWPASTTALRACSPTYDCPSSPSPAGIRRSSSRSTRPSAGPPSFWCDTVATVLPPPSSGWPPTDRQSAVTGPNDITPADNATYRSAALGLARYSWRTSTSTQLDRTRGSVRKTFPTSSEPRIRLLGPTTMSTCNWRTAVRKQVRPFLFVWKRGTVSGKSWLKGHSVTFQWQYAVIKCRLLFSILFHAVVESPTS